VLRVDARYIRCSVFLVVGCFVLKLSVLPCQWTS